MKIQNVALVLASLSICSRGAAAQTCDLDHYRWPEKTSTALLGSAAQPVSIAAMLNWRVPPIGRGMAFRCAARVPAERRVLTVVGWVRRVDRTKDDGDWHIELTERRRDRVGACIVVEIPPAEIHPVFRAARASLDSVLQRTRLNRHGDLAQPIQLRITGAAFYDGEHLGKKGQIRPHGRCNSSASALWEIHPVYRIEPATARDAQYNNPLRK
jgi:hypothetical protein